MFRTLFLIAAASLFAVNVTFQEKPVTYQLYPRTAGDIGTVSVRGSLNDAGYDSLALAVERNGRPFSRTASPAVYNGNSAAFAFSAPIRAELAEYRVRLYADDSLCLSVDSLVAGDAYGVMGTSNAITFMVGDVHEYCRTYTSAGKWKISEQGNTYEVGPDVGVWAQHLAFRINREQGVPVCVINGGTPSMGISYFLPGSAGYTTVLNRASATGLRSHLKAVFMDEGYADDPAAHASGMRSIYAAWKTDYPALKKAYVNQLGYWYQSWDADIPLFRNIREVERRLPETCPDIRVMATVGSPAPAVHWGAEGYRSIADKLYRLVARDIYGSRDTAGINPPNVLRAYYSSSSRDRITLVFDQPTYWRDSLGHRLADYFALDSAYKVVDSGWSDPRFNRVTLKLKAPSSAANITYLTAGFYHSGDRTGAEVSDPTYRGPFLYNARRVGAFAFHEVPIESPAAVDTSAVTGLALTSTKISLLRFESAQLLAEVTYAGGRTDTNKGVFFRSLDTFVVRVDPSGLVRGCNPGTGHVAAFKGALSDTVAFTVGNGFATLAGLEFSAKAPSLRTLLAGDSMPFALAGLKIENGDTLRFFMDTLATVTVPSPYLTTVGNFIHAAQAGNDLLVTAEAAGLRCSTRVNVVPLPGFIRRVNFQAANAPLSSIPGWIMNSGGVYSPGQGLGWVNPSGLSGYDLDWREPNYFRKTMVRTAQNQTEQAFRIDAPVGRYTIRIRNFNLFACFENSWIRHGADTLLMSPSCNYQWDGDAQVTREIDITGNSGLVLNIYGTVCYLVLVSADCPDFNLVARDEDGIAYPPPLFAKTEGGRRDRMSSGEPVACPNPFNPAAAVRFMLPGGVSAQYSVFNVRGQLVRAFRLPALNGTCERSLVVDAGHGTPMASGIYYGRLERSDGKRFVLKLALVR